MKKLLVFRQYMYKMYMRVPKQTWKNMLVSGLGDLLHVFDRSHASAVGLVGQAMALLGYQTVSGYPENET